MNQTNRRYKKISRFLLGVLLLFLTTTGLANPVDGIPVLLYHHVNDQETVMSELTLSSAEFARQLHLLYIHGFRTITLAQLGLFMRGERVELPDKPILITFDDGYADSYYQALPLLNQTGYSAAVFIVGINFDRANRLSSPQVREMTANNIEIGAHSMTHANLTKLDETALRFEVAGSKRTAEKVIQSGVSFFAYPGGFYNLPSLEAVEAAGFQGAFSVLPGFNRPERDNIYLLRRIPIFRHTNFDRLMRQLERPRSKPSLLDY